jgi:putative transposase
VPITRVNQVWSTDITDIRLHAGLIYLVAVLDWFSRDVLSWAVSIPMDGGFCLDALEHALGVAQPEVFNSDPGAQCTSTEFTSRLAGAGIQISMDGRGRALDNVVVERLWRTVKYEEVYVQDYQTPREAATGLAPYFGFYNGQRLHQALDSQPPAAVYFGSYV